MTTAQRAVLTAAFLLFAQTAHADTTTNAAAETLFQEGRSLFNDGKYAEACVRFARSQQLDPAVGTLLNMGDCYKRTGKTASAWVAYRDAVRLATERKDERRAQVATTEAQQLEPTLARIRIEVEGFTPGLVVLLNNEPVDSANFASPIPVDPGEDSLQASAPGRKPWSLTLEIPAGTTKTIKVPPLALKNPPGNPLATGLEIGGGVVLGASLVFGGIALARWNSVTDTCPEKHCPNKDTQAEQTTVADSARTLAHISTATALLGAVALGVGLYLDLTTSKKVALGLDGSNVALRLRWP